MTTSETDIDTQAAGEGIGLYYASGDDGDYSGSIGRSAPLFVSNFATSVGGTSEGIDARGDTVLSVGWGDTESIVRNGRIYGTGAYVFGSGGGPSVRLDQPAYQKGVVPSPLSINPNSLLFDGQKVRVQPDIADLADPETGFQVAISPITDDANLATGPLQFDTYGGTSLATSLAAAKMALVQQQTGKTLGFSNPLLYKAAIYHSAGITDVTPLARLQLLYKHDTVSGINYVYAFNWDSSLTTENGYDDQTGIGTLNVNALAAFTEQILK